MSSKFLGRERLLMFINARYEVFKRKERGEPKPWTSDPILQKYRFCNVRREDDTVTRWVKTNIVDRYKNDPNLLFMLCIARQINLPESLAALINAGGFAWPKGDRWQEGRLQEVLQARSAAGFKVYTSAYMLTCVWPAGYTGDRSKPAFTASVVLRPMWSMREALNATEKTLAATHAALLNVGEGSGWGSFTAAQVVADYKHSSRMRAASDWWTWAASGPGSRRGLNRVLNRAVDAPWHEEDWFNELSTLRLWIDDEWGGPRLCAQNVQNCLCEFDKYERARLGEGRPRQKYEGLR